MEHFWVDSVSALIMGLEGTMCFYWIWRSFIHEKSTYKFEDLKHAYLQQIEGLVLGECHIILLETIVDTLTAKAGLEAYEEFFNRNKLPKLPLFISDWPINDKGENLSNDSIEEFYKIMKKGNPFWIGLNCAFRAKQMLSFVEILSEISNVYIHAYPNAGFPDENLEYKETPESFSEEIEEYFKHGINAIGGWWGTDHAFIQKISEMAKKYEPRKLLKGI